MLKIDIVCVGRLKESYFKDALIEYSKRLSGYCNLNITEVKDEKTEVSGPGDVAAILKTEAERILGRIPGDACVIALDIKGRKYSSEGLAKRLSELMTQGVSHICFVIGGSLGLHEDVLAKADVRLSFSDMTFPHQLMRVILLEQVYRCFKIIRGEPYHK